MTSHTCRRCEISKNLTWNPTLTAKNTPLFLFPYMGHSLQIFAWGMPLHAHVFSFTHKTVVLSHFRCVHPENQTKIFLILTFLWITTNVAYTRLEVITKQHSVLYSKVYHRRQTDLLLRTILLLPPLRSSSKHGHRRSKLLLYSISMYGTEPPSLTWVTVEVSRSQYNRKLYQAIQKEFQLLPPLSPQSQICKYQQQGCMNLLETFVFCVWTNVKSASSPFAQLFSHAKAQQRSDNILP